MIIIHLVYLLCFDVKQSMQNVFYTSQNQDKCLALQYSIDLCCTPK